jgi:hypothetical protein
LYRLQRTIIPVLMVIRLFGRREYGFLHLVIRC